MFIADINNNTPNMPVKKFAINQEHGFIGDSTTKYKPKPHIESEVLIEYRLHRNICYYIQHGGECEWSDEQIQNVKNIYFKEEFKLTLF